MKGLELKIATIHTKDSALMQIYCIEVVAGEILRQTWTGHLCSGGGSSNREIESSFRLINNIIRKPYSRL